MSAISVNKNREAVLRHIDLKMAIMKVIEDHVDLDIPCIASLLKATAYELLSVGYLPSEYRPPKMKGPDDDRV